MSTLSLKLIDRDLFDSITSKINQKIIIPASPSDMLIDILELYAQFRVVYNKCLIYEDIYFEKHLTFPIFVSGNERVVRMNIRKYSFIIVQMQLIFDYLASYRKENFQFTNKIHSTVLRMVNNSSIIDY